MFRREFYILGDGESKELTIDLKKSPVGMNFVGDSYPKVAYLEESTGIKAMTGEGILRFEFDKAPPKDSVVKARVTLYY